MSILSVVLPAYNEEQMVGKTCRVLGHVGMLNLVADVTGLKCQPGDLVTIQINPLDLKGMEIEYR